MRTLFIVSVALMAASAMADVNKWYAITPSGGTPIASGVGELWASDARLWTSGLSGADALEARGKTEMQSNASSLDTTPYHGMLLIFH
jgi:hypothetical protein